VNDTPTEAVKDARQHRFDALGFCRHVAMKKFSAGALVAATLAGQWVLQFLPMLVRPPRPPHDRRDHHHDPRNFVVRR